MVNPINHRSFVFLLWGIGVSMCKVCEIEGLDWRFRNGAKHSQIMRLRMYNFYEDREALIGLCHCHGHEFFLIGERRFLERHPLLIKEMIAHKKNYIVRAPSTF